MVNAVPFISILRRASHCKFPELVMANRLLMQCYTIDVDSDVGFHYVLHIPDENKYADGFYDEFMLIRPAEVIGCYNTGHRILAEKRRARLGL